MFMIFYFLVYTHTTPDVSPYVSKLLTEFVFMPTCSIFMQRLIADVWFCCLPAILQISRKFSPFPGLRDNVVGYYARFLFRRKLVTRKSTGEAPKQRRIIHHIAFIVGKHSADMTYDMKLLLFIAVKFEAFSNQLLPLFLFPWHWMANK